MKTQQQVMRRTHRRVNNDAKHVRKQRDSQVVPDTRRKHQTMKVPRKK